MLSNNGQHEIDFYLIAEHCWETWKPV